MPSVYVSHVANQLPATPPLEGLIYPLLRRAEGVWLGARVVTGPFAGYARSGNTLTGDTNGTFPLVDGVALNIGDVLLLSQGISAVDNGLYAISDIGNPSTPWVATRIPEFDSQAEALPSTFVWVGEGASGAGKRFVLTNSTAPVINSENITFQEDSEAVFYWAFAVPQPTETSSIETRRKNRLVCAVLRALGFVHDEKNATSGLKFDFFHLADDRLIGLLSSTVFDAATLPDLSGDPANLEVRNPRNAEQNLKLATAATEDIKADSPVKVHRFVFANTGGLTPGRFDLGLSGQPTSPGFTANITLEPGLKSEFPSSTLPVLTFDQSGVAGALRCNTVEVIASNKMPGSAITIAADVRHDRLTVDVATLVCTEPDTDPKLAIEVFPSISFQPEPDLPVTVTLSHDGVCLRLQPRVAAGDTLPARVTVHRFKPCVRVTIRGPVIHADAASSGALEALRLLEPAERKFESTVEQVNDFLVYSFEVCLPQMDAAELRLEDLERLDAVVLSLPNWPEVSGIDLSNLGLFCGNLSEFFSQLVDLSQSLTVTFPDVGLPSLTEYDFAKFDVVLPDKITVQYPDVNLSPILSELETLPNLWSVKLLRPQKPDLELKVKLLTIDQVTVTFQFEDVDLGTLGISVSARLRVNWNIEIQPPSLNANILELTTGLPTVRLPKIDGDWDIRLLKVRARVHGVDLGTFAIKKLEGKKVELDIPQIGGTFPDMKVFEGASIEFALDLTLPLTKCFLSDLLGDLGSVDFRLSVPQPTAIDFAKIGAAFGSLATPMIPLELVVRVPHPTKPKLEWDELKLVLGMRFDLSKFRLLDNRIYFFLPQRRAFGDANLAPRQVMDFDIFTLTFPNRPEPLGFPTVENHDGYLDLTSREFVIDLKYKEGAEPTPPPRIHAFFPGGMDPEAARLGREGVENLGNTHVNYTKYRQEYAKRFDLELDEVDPKLWPNTGPDRLMFRFNSNGLTFAANLGKTEVEIDSSGFSDDGASDGNSAGLIKPFKCQPQEKQRELRSRIVIIDNELKEAGVYAKTEVPGVEKLMAEISVVLRQRQKGMLPDVLASMELERADEAPLAEFSIKLLEMSLDRLELGLIWRMQEKQWDYSIIADGTIAFTGAAALVPDLEGLRAPSIQVVGLDLRRMNLRQLRVPIILVKPVRFDILDGMFGVELGDLEIGWEFDGNIPKPRLLACELATLTFKNPGALEVSVSVGGLHIEFDANLKAHVRLPSSLGIEVALGSSARFAGRVGWVETDVERYLFASGKVMLEGLPEVRGLLKCGTGLKYSGRREINLVLYGEMDLDEQLFSGAVVKSLGLGVGLNNRLAAIPPSPSADAILRRIDLVKPGEVEGWQFVREGGFYMSVIGSVTLASNLGEPDVLNAYVAALVVSIDTNFDLVAAGKLWLSCSVKGQRENTNNPAFVGAMVLSPRQRKLEVVLESRKNAYVEQNDLIKKLLDKGFVRFAFRMTPQLVDFHLAEVSYRDQMFGVQFEFRGEYRFAIFKRAVLLKNELSATGSISKSLSGGSGGFDLDGQAYLRLGYGGLLSDRGAMAYAFIEAGIRFRVSAWIEIGFSISFKICGKRYSKSWSIVFRARVPQLELTFRGHIAVADRGGLGGFDLQVGINMPICGYRLNVTVGWAVNAELYQEVRAQVAAFEAELEAAVKKLDNPETTDGPSPAPLALALHAPGTALESAVASAPVPPPSESWLLYSREVEDTSVALLLPAPDARWLTPIVATINRIKVEGNEATFEISQSISGLPSETTPVRLLGLRPADPQFAVQVAKLNGTWQAKITGEMVKLSVANIGAGEYDLLGGVWRIDETVSGLSTEDQDTVPYLDEVERAVLRTSPWLTLVAPSNASTVTTSSPHEITGDVRILLRNGDAVQDPGGAKREYNSTDVANLTAKAKRIDDNTLDLSELGTIAPAAGWQLATAIEIAPPWSARNRLAAVRDGAWNNNEYRDYTGAATTWAETAAKAAKAGVDEAASTSASYAVVFDERYTSADPRFAPEDAPVEPGVLSTRFRPIDDVEAVGVDAILEAARRFEEATQSVARQQLHGAFDLDESEAIQQARAQATQLLVHRLSDPRGPDNDNRFEAPVEEHQADKVTYGWYCKSEKAMWDRVIAAIKNGDEDVLFVRRAGQQAEKVAVALPDNIGSKAGSAPTLLPIRQEFVIDEASEVRERGRVSVLLPIRYSEEVLRRRPQDIGRLQVYRRISDGPEELVFDQLRPDISQLNKKQVFSKSRQQFVDDPTKVDRNERKDFDLTATRVTNSRVKFDENQSRLLLPERTAPGDKLLGFSCRIELTDRKITRAEHRAGIVTLEFEPPLNDGDTEVHLELISEGLIVSRPVLISDEFAVTDRQFESAELRAALGSGRAPLVRYSLRLLAEDDPGGANLKDLKPWPAPVPLFIPKRKEPLPNLALAIPVGSLLQSSAEGVTFQLVDLSDETPKLAEQDGRPLAAEEFEFWLDGDILRQSGFYAGEAADPNPPREGDGERVTLAAVNSTDGFEFTAGKMRVATELITRTNYYRIADPSAPEPPPPRPVLRLQPGAAFRAFFRLKGDTTIRSLRRLPILLVREFPRYWDATVRYRIIDTAEIIPAAHRQRVANQVAKPLVVDFSADDRYEAGRAAIRSVWPSLTLLEGGVELQFRDFDDSSMRSRTLVEVLEADEFSKSQTDFRDDTFWTPRPPDRVERYASRVVAKAETHDLKAAYLWKRPKPDGTGPEGEIDAIRRLEGARKLLEEAGDWKMRAKAVRAVQVALLAFEKSPLNLNRVGTKQLIELLRLALRAVVVGNKVGADEPAKVDEARRQNQALLELLTRIEQTRAEIVSDSAATDLAFFDRDTARKLAGIARRRLAIADEAVALGSIDAVPEPATGFATGDPRVRDDAWTTITKDAKSLAESLDKLPLTNELTVQFEPRDGDAGKQLCLTLIEKLKNEIEGFPLEQFVPRAAGLSELLHQLNEKIRVPKTPAGLLKRPHHELTTTKKEDGEIVPREVPLRALLPARARQAKLGTIPEPPDEHLERLGVRAGHVATLFANGQVAIWTTRGQAVHDEPMERVQYFTTGITNARSIALDEVAEGPRMLIDRPNDVQLWDAGKAKQLRSYGSATGATFAATLRGLEVAVVNGEKVTLHTTEYPEAKAPSKLQFAVGEETTAFSGPVAYHDEIHVLAAVRENVIYFWRDMGRPENKTPFHWFSLGTTGSPTATHIQPVTLPSGAGFVIATANYPTALFFLDPMQRRAEPVAIRDGASTITQLAVDRRELTASVVIAGKVYSYDLLAFEKWAEEPTASDVAILLGRHNGGDESYLVVSSGGDLRVLGDSGSKEVQVLPAPVGLGNNVPESGNVVAIASHLMTARTATAAADPLSLFHLWERMGFALDLAAQDETTRLLKLGEVCAKIDEAIGAMDSTYKAGHHIYRIEGEEPDAEFRDDRVGFSHVNVAVVPEEFLAACLEPNTAALEVWLKNRAIKLAQEIQPDDPEEVKQKKRDENQRELDYIVHMTQLVGVPHESRFGTVTGSTDSSAVPRGGELRLQPRSDRFVRVPASAGFSHWSWTLPDRKGHRMLVAARRVSRYEPLLRWWLNLHTRFDLPEEIALGGDLTISNVNGNQVTVNTALPLETGWQPLRFEIVKGDGAGQRRELLPLQPGASRSDVFIDLGDPWLDPKPRTGSIARVMDAAPGWRLVVLDPIHDPARGEGAGPLMVYQYPHSRKPRFSYQIPLDGMRATYNQISRVRTGYHGIEAAFRYYLPDQIDNPETPILKDLLAMIESSADTPTGPGRIVTSVAGGAEPDVRLFRHERMVSLPGLPFFYRYRLDVRSAHKARTLEYDRSTAAERLPDDDNASPPAQRLPACLGLNVMVLQPLVLSGKLPANQPTDKRTVRLHASGVNPFTSDVKLRVRQSHGSEWIEKQVTAWNDGLLTLDTEYADQPAEGWEYELEAASAFEAVLYLSANRDHLTREEARSEPEPVMVQVGPEDNTVDVNARELPDFFMDYSLYRLQQAGQEPLRSLGDLFSVVGTISMPWSPNFKVPSSFPDRDNALKKPFVSVGSGLKLVMLDVGRPPSEAETNQEASVTIRRIVIDGSSYWQVRFGIANEPGQTILEEGKVFIQATRDGKITRAVPCTSGNGSAQ